MKKTMNKTKNYIEIWNNMLIEDKMLLVMEIGCYLLSYITLMVIIFSIDRLSNTGICILLFSCFGFLWCGLDARSSRDTHIRTTRKSLKLQ